MIKRLVYSHASQKKSSYLVSGTAPQPQCRFQSLTGAFSPASHRDRCPSFAAREGKESRDVSHTAREYMKISATVFLSLLLLFGAAASANAQGVEWGTLNDEVHSLYQ